MKSYDSLIDLRSEELFRFGLNMGRFKTTFAAMALLDFQPNCYKFFDFEKGVTI